MSVRAKFKCESVTHDNTSAPELGSTIKLFAVMSGSKENESFFKATPSGGIVLSIVNPEATKLFEVGKEYFVTFDLAKPSE